MRSSEEREVSFFKCFASNVGGQRDNLKIVNLVISDILSISVILVGMLDWEMFRVF